MPQSPFHIKLKDRALITIEGADRKEFLQGLITNDINNTSTDTLLYACLLNAQGKFLHDFFIHNIGDAFLLDCEGGERAQDLNRRFNMYRLRSDVQISIEQHIDVYAAFNDTIGAPDPRHKNMGNRSFKKPNSPEKTFNTWDHKRISLTIPDGSRDLIVEKSTMDEASMDSINAIDYAKGCYIGQELTARMHYRGLGKRKLQTVPLDNIPNDAQLRSSCDDIGLALVRIKKDEA